MLRGGHNPQGPPPPNSQKKKKKRKGSVYKTFAVFKCGSDACGKQWSSAHGWQTLPTDHLKCEFCKGNAKVLQAVDEMCELDHFICACEESWDRLHGDQVSSEPCVSCGVLVTSAGTQSRYGTHYWYRCESEGCGAEWEDADVGRVFSQRCKKCGSGGRILGIRKESPEERTVRLAKSQSYFGRMAGSHNVDGCDMCQALISKDIARDCTRHSKVLVYDDDGESYNLELIK